MRKGSKDETVKRRVEEEIEITEEVEEPQEEKKEKKRRGFFGLFNRNS